VQAIGSIERASFHGRRFAAASLSPDRRICAEIPAIDNLAGSILLAQAVLLIASRSDPGCVVVQSSPRA
jgi:hypothetical protein